MQRKRFSFPQLEAYGVTRIPYYDRSTEFWLPILQYGAAAADSTVTSFFDRGQYKDYKQGADRIKEIAKMFSMLAAEDSSARMLWRGSAGSADYNFVTYSPKKHRLAHHVNKFVLPEEQVIILDGTAESWTKYYAFQHSPGFVNRAAQALKWILELTRYHSDFDNKNNENAKNGTVIDLWGRQQIHTSVEDILRRSTGFGINQYGVTDPYIMFIQNRADIAAQLPISEGGLKLNPTGFLSSFREAWWHALGALQVYTGSSGADNLSRMTRLPVDELTELLEDVLLNMFSAGTLVRNKYLDDKLRYIKSGEIKSFIFDELEKVLDKDEAVELQQKLLLQFPDVPTFEGRYLPSTVDIMDMLLEVIRTKKNSDDRMLAITRELQGLQMRKRSQPHEDNLSVISTDEFLAAAGWPAQKLDTALTLSDTDDLLSQKVFYGPEGYVAIKNKAVEPDVWHLDIVMASDIPIVEDAKLRKSFFQPTDIDDAKARLTRVMDQLLNEYAVATSDKKGTSSVISLEKQIVALLGAPVFKPLVHLPIPANVLSRFVKYYRKDTFEEYTIKRQNFPSHNGMTMSEGDGIFWNAAPGKFDLFDSLKQFESLDATKALTMSDRIEDYVPNSFYPHRVDDFRAVITRPDEEWLLMRPNMRYADLYIEAMTGSMLPFAYKHIVNGWVASKPTKIANFVRERVQSGWQMSEYISATADKLAYFDDPVLLFKSYITAGDRVAMARLVETILISDLIGEVEAERTSVWKYYHPDLPTETSSVHLNDMDKSRYKDDPRRLKMIKIFRIFLRTVIYNIMEINEKGEQDMETRLKIKELEEVK